MTAREPVPPASPEPPATTSLALARPERTAVMAPAPEMATRESAPPEPSAPAALAPHARPDPTGAEQKLSVDRLRTARNEIFVRKGFKDDTLRVTSGAAELEARTSVAVTDPHSQYLTTAQLQRLSRDQLVLVRNEILARRGRYFKDPALRAYFEQFAWYRPYAWEVPLTPVERANVDLIWSYQQTMLAPGPAARPWRTPPM
jgi:YARHG domain